MSALWLVLTILLTAVLASCNRAERPLVAQPPTSTITPEPLLPTRTRTPAPTIEQVEKRTTTPVASLTAVPLPAPSSTPETPAVPQRSAAVILPSDDLGRYGLTGGISSALRAAEAGLLYGALLNWHVVPNPPATAGQFWQMVRLEEAGIRRTTWETIAATLAAHPGSFWLIGNEPDVRWQDNVTPQRYAELYHELYTFIKERDPEAKVVIGGVSQPTPLRRAYLDIVLQTYLDLYGEALPVDVWNVHAFTLREEAGSWGVDIPPGMDGAQGILYEIDDHDDLAILEQNLLDFRAWMAERGYAGWPLVISEYGILMPEDYGFPLERTAAFLTGSFDLFRSLAGEQGYAPDDGRLVQWWFWYSVFDDELYPTGNLVDYAAGTLTPLGEVWAAYVRAATAP